LWWLLQCDLAFIPNPMLWATILQQKCVRGMREDKEASWAPQLLTQKLTQSWWLPCCNATWLCGVFAGGRARGLQARSESLMVQENSLKPLVKTLPAVYTAHRPGWWSKLAEAT
jgi:hypothetical protein